MKVVEFLETEANLKTMNQPSNDMHSNSLSPWPREWRDCCWALVAHLCLRRGGCSKGRAVWGRLPLLQHLGMVGHVEAISSL